MKQLNLKSLLPIVTAIVIFIALTFGYFTPLLKGKVIVQSDMTQNRGMAKEVTDFKAQYHTEPLWTNSMFGGMPAYQIAISYPANLVTPLRNVFMLWFPTPANMVFSYMLGFFILLLVLRVDKWLSIVGAIGFGFSAFFFLIIDAGHNTQALAIGYMAPVFAGVILVCRGRYLVGGALTALFMALELLCNHPQIAYYLILFCLIYVAFEWFARIRQKEYKDILKGLLVFMIAGVLAVGCNISNLWNTYDYAKYTIRGPSELTSAKGEEANQTSGLDKDYATHWSLGKAETMTLMIPGFKGLGDGILIGENKDAVKDLDSQMKQVASNFPQYWGDQPGTSSPYAGAIIVFLFVLGLFIVPGRIKWALVAITIFSITLAWGKNMMWLTDLFLDYFPGYNKFRAVSMILVLAEVAIPILAVLAVDKMLKTPDLFKQKIKLVFGSQEVTFQNALIISFVVTGGLSLLFYLMPSLTDFTWWRDDEILGSYAKSNGQEVADQIAQALQTARIAIFKAEAIRSFLFITGAAALVWMYAKAIINKGILLPLLGILILFDLAMVDKNFLNDKNFTSKQEAKNPFPETAADKAVLEDKDPSYRVLDVTDQQNGPFNSARASYYHKSIGGYHAAKLRRYQELIQAHIVDNMQNVMGALRAPNPTDSSIRATFAEQGVLNMLNMRYLIYNADAPPIKNRYALGNAWFVSDIKMVANADEELKTIGEVNPGRTIVVDERYKAQLDGFTPKPDNTATIKLTDYKPNDLSYESNASSEQLAVFSEIYYKDWNAYVDGKLTPHFSSDWVLRAMRVPAGKHTIEFKFEPTIYYTGEKISLASCLLLFGFIGVSLFMAWKKKEV
ncbi:MAG: hypothetical protein JWP12_1190 [Bacteroidetes bacterium]|nr:hypothetical protein [Bacteroidota bacterium]